MTARFDVALLAPLGNHSRLERNLGPQPVGTLGVCRGSGHSGHGLAYRLGL